jgi:hypothetical protein
MFYFLSSIFYPLSSILYSLFSMFYPLTSNFSLPITVSRKTNPISFPKFDFKLRNMKLYYIETNPESNGKHLVHQSECIKIPNFLSRRFIGYFNSCKEALIESSKTYPNVKGCPVCLSACHTTANEIKK